MRQLNKIPSELMVRYKPSACTDVTGFGLLGHLKEMCEASDISAEIYFNKVALLSDVESLVNQGIVPGGTENNIRFLKNHLTWDSQIREYQKIIICDAQTSGGLLISLSPKNAEEFIKEYKNLGFKATVIGNIVPRNKTLIDIYT